MLTEQEVLSQIPDRGFLATYVQHAMLQTTAPAAYHIAVGLSLLASTCPHTYMSPFAGGTACNLYVLLAGRSGLERKSTALRIGKELLFLACPDKIGDMPGSAEGLIDSIASRPQQIISFSEFGKFLATAQRGYFEPVKTALTDLWDSQAVQRTLAGNRVIRVDNPRLSCMAACAIPYLEKHTLAEDWTGGFMGRWALMYAQEERQNSFPVSDNRYRDALADRLAELNAIEEGHGQCQNLTDDAREYWDNWYYTKVSTYGDDTNVAGLRSRMPAIAQKAAMLYAWDLGYGSQSQDWLLNKECIHYGCLFANMHLQSSQSLFARIASSPEARLRRTVLGALETMQGGQFHLGQMLRATQMGKRTLINVLDGLIDEGFVQRASHLGGSPVYNIITTDPEAIPSSTYATFSQEYTRLNRPK